MIFSIDVEDWPQSVLDRSLPVTNRVYDNTLVILDLLDKYEHKATFFTLANVASKHPNLIKKIVNAGHEVASHGSNHHNMYTLSADEIKQDVDYSVKLLEDISGKKVIGYRAPNFSLKEYLFEWYCEALANNGVKYDSSMFPMPVKRYGIEKKYSLDIFDKYNIDEHYLSHVEIGNKKLPFFGGGYFRLAPYSWTKRAGKKIESSNSTTNNEGVFYMHPFEIDTGEFAEVRRLYKKIPLIRNQFFVARGTVLSKLNHLMADFDFTSFEDKYYSNTKLSSNGKKNIENMLKNTNSVQAA